MAPTDRLKLARDAFRAFAAGDRAAIEGLRGRLHVLQPARPGSLDREGFFERCWPNSHLIEAFDVREGS